MDAHDMSAGTAHLAYLCDLSVHDGKGGSFIGHVLPGIVLSIWGLHWFLSISMQHLRQQGSSVQYTLLADSSSLINSGKQARRSVNSQNREASTHRAFVLEPRGLHLEAWLKLMLPAVAIMLEVSLSGTRRLHCPPGSGKAGELDVRHMNSWSHVTHYPPIILSGLVDLIHAYWRPLPHFIPHAFLSSAFATNAFLMLAHGKVEPLDGLIHHYVGLCMAAVALAVMGHALWPRSFAWGAAKSLALLMEGAWFFAITHIMFSHDTTWAASQPGDVTRIMFVPVLFAWIFIGLTFFMLLVFLSMESMLAWINKRGGSTSAAAGKGSAQDDVQYSGLLQKHPKTLQLAVSAGPDDEHDVMV